MDKDIIYAIDRIENNIAICEQLETKQKIELPLTTLPTGIAEGTIIKYQEGIYIQEPDIERIRRARLRTKFNKLKEPTKGKDPYE